MKFEDDQRAQTLFRACGAAIAKIEFPGMPGEPTAKSYYGDALGSDAEERNRALDTFLRYYLDLFETAGRSPHGLRVLEVGSGFGLGPVAVATLGAAEAHGVELVPWQVQSASRMCEVLPREISERVNPIVGNAIALPFPDAGFDVVFSLEAISHYIDYAPFLDEAHRVLRRGGMLVISDGNNGLNPIIRRRNRRLWASHEADPATQAVDPDAPFVFVDKRERIVSATDPSLTRAVAHEIALHTAGMVRSEVEDATRNYVESGVLPDSRYRPGTLTVHPEHEMVMERLFNPFELGREIADRGFDVTVRGHWGGAGNSRPVRIVNGVLRALSRLTMPTARSFRIRAVKR